MSSEPRLLDPRRSWPYALAAGLAVFLALVWRFDLVCDDAYISFRYSRNLAEGLGLRFNPASARPVEGYSNFLWVVYLALFEFLDLDLGLAARASGVLSGALLVVVLVRALVPRLPVSGGGLALWSGVLFLASFPSLAMWSTGGLATAPFALCLFLGAQLLMGNPERPAAVPAGLCALAAALLRADGTAFCVLVLGVALLCAWRSGNRALLRATGIAGAILVSGVAAHVAWRLAYYGDYLPNTARIKVGFSAERVERGRDYLVVFLMTLPSVLVALGVGAACGLRRAGPLGLAALVVALGNMGYAVYVGGDFMAMGRFFLPMLPFLAWLFAVGCARLPRAGVVLGASLVVLNLLPVVGRYPTPRSMRAAHHFRFNSPEYWDELGMWRSMKRNARIWKRDGLALARLTRPGESMILGPIGAIGYHTDLHLYDLYGLTSHEVSATDVPTRPASPGHDRAVLPGFFLQHEPTYLGYVVVGAGGRQVARRLPGYMQPYADRVTIEAHPAPEDLGFPPGLEIWLLRLRY